MVGHTNPLDLNLSDTIFFKAFPDLPFSILGFGPLAPHQDSSHTISWSFQAFPVEQKKKKKPKLSELYFALGHLILEVIRAVKNWLSNHETRPLGILSFFLFFSLFIRIFRAAEPQAKRNSCTGKFSTLDLREQGACWGVC